MYLGDTIIGLVIAAYRDRGDEQMLTMRTEAGAIFFQKQMGEIRAAYHKDFGQPVTMTTRTARSDCNVRLWPVALVGVPVVATLTAGQVVDVTDTVVVGGQTWAHIAVPAGYVLGSLLK
jgi:hypothetical protein